MNIRELGKVMVPAEPVMPLVLDRSSRANDDSYSEAGGETSRGMEEEDDAGSNAKLDEAGRAEEAASDPDKTVDFFA